MTTNRNKAYKRGSEKERTIAKRARDLGNIAFRSAGSRSPIDVVIINHKLREISLIQCKHSLALRGGIPPKLKAKLEQEFGFLDGIYKVQFKAL